MGLHSGPEGSIMKAAFRTLGCKVNRYETEALMQRFAGLGFDICEEDERADVYVINTCTVTNLADRKSRQFIRRARKLNADAVVCVTGCYAQINPDEAASIEGVDLVVGTDEKHMIPELVMGLLEKRESSGAKIVMKERDDLREYEELSIRGGMTGRTRAFIKIEDGCDHYCTYCIIPYARGHIRSRTPESIAEEVRDLVEHGCKEIVLTGINTAFYGRDLGLPGVEPLIAELNSIPGDFRIRLSSLEPTVIGAKDILGLLGYEKLCHHLHLALQSGSDKVLSEMRRGYTSAEYLDIVQAVREADPLYGFSTDIIVGFPGETDADFEGSCSVTQTAGFGKVHVFKYSRRQGTPAAERSDQVPGDIKNERSAKLIGLALDTAAGFFQRNIGSEQVVLVERSVTDPVTGESQGIEGEPDFVKDAESGFVCGYTGNYIKTYIEGGEELYNKFVRVRMTGPYRDGMKAEIIY